LPEWSRGIFTLKKRVIGACRGTGWRMAQLL